MSDSASELKQELINYKDKYLYPLYIRGELGAQQIPGFNNKCVTSFNVCDIPDDFDGNIERIDKLLSFSQSETEREIIKGLKLDINSYYILGDEWAKRRIGCQKKCLKGKRCELCKRLVEFAKTLEYSKDYEVFKRRMIDGERSLS